MRAALALVLVLAMGQAAAQEAWIPELVDPGAALGTASPADLILPMPCGGGMAFQRVVVPTDIANPLADRPFRMGQSDAETGFSDYLRPTYLRGAFVDAEAGTTHYYIARYEMNAAQARALRGDCDAPFTRRDQFAQGDLSWFDGVELLRGYTEWLLGDAPDSLPADGDRIGFLRLPTEAEWEFAARGGVAADQSTFLARRYFTEGEMADHAHFQAAGQGRGKLRPVGIRQPNPLGLYDLYGNAEELMLEPYRLNAIGRAHGQAGGLVTRGGAIDTAEAGLYTAQRREYPLFSARSGKALVGPFFGLRPVISAHIVTDADFDAIRDGWIAEADDVPDGTADPLSALADLLEAEVDPRRKEALGSLQLEFRVAREAAEESLSEAAKSTLLSGAAFVDALVQDSAEFSQLHFTALGLRDRAQRAVGAQRAALVGQWSEINDRIAGIRARLRTYLLSYRAALETLSTEIDADQRDAAFESLRSDLDASGQTDLLERLLSFWDDVGLYAQAPDMSEDELLRMATEGG